MNKKNAHYAHQKMQSRRMVDTEMGSSVGTVNGDIVNSFPSHHKTLSDLKRARSMVLKALPDMFYYLNDTNVPFSSNSLERYFSRVKWGYRNH